MKVGKTVIKKKLKKEPKQEEEKEIISEENQKSKMIKGKTKLGKKIKKETEEKTASEFIIEQIIISYCTEKWKNNALTLKNIASSKSNKQSKNIRHLFYIINNTFRYRKYLYLMELFEKMISMPFPEGVIHDPDFGKITIVYNPENKNKIEEEEKNYEIAEEIVIEDSTTNEPLRNIKKNNNTNNNNEEKKDYFKEENEELKDYFYRNDGSPLNRFEIEKDINKLIDSYPEKDIDVERILHSKRLQYKLKHPRFSPFTKLENLDSFVRYLYTYKPSSDNEKNEKTIFIKNKTNAYY